MASWLDGYEVGDRVSFTKGFEADYPMDFKLAEGAMGTVVEKYDDPTRDMMLQVRLDDHVEQLDEWDNVLHLVPVDLMANPGFVDQGPVGLVVAERPVPAGP